MRNLLLAELYRWKKNIFFYLALIVSIISGLILGITSLGDYGYDCMFLFPLFFASCAIIPMIIGSDFSSGTIRNKIVNGKSKKSIYFSHLLISLLYGIIIEISFWLIFILINHMYFGVLFELIPSMLLSLLSVISLCVMISMLCTNRSVSIIITISVFLLSIVLSTTLDNKLEQPQYYNHTYISDDGTETEKIVENKNYLDGFPRTFFELSIPLLSDYQLQEIDTLMYCYRNEIVQQDETDNTGYYYFPIYSIGKIICFSSIGYFVFKRKNIK